MVFSKQQPKQDATKVTRCYTESRVILEILHERGIADTDICRLTGIHRVTINNIRHGKQTGKTSLKHLQKLIQTQTLTENEKKRLDTIQAESKYYGMHVETLEGASNVVAKTSPIEDRSKPVGIFARIKKQIDENARKYDAEQRKIERAYEIVAREERKKNRKAALTEIRNNTPVEQSHAYVPATEYSIPDIVSTRNICAICKRVASSVTTIFYYEGQECIACQPCSIEHQTFLYKHRLP